MTSRLPYSGGTWKPGRARLVGAIVDIQLKVRLDSVCVDTAGFSVDPSCVDVWVANHTSRYDGFLIWKLKHSLNTNGRLFTIMLEQSLRRHSVFEGAGAVGLTPGSTSSVRSVVRFVETVPVHGDSIVIFPQGRIYAGDRIPPGFRSITRLGTRTGPPARFVPCAIAVEMLEGKRPTAFVRLGQVMPATDASAAEHVEAAVTGALRSLRSDLAEYGEALPDQWDRLRPGDPSRIRIQ